MKSEYQFVDALTFLYHSFAHSTDGILTMEEEDTIVEKLLNWDLLHSVEEIKNTINKSHRWYVQCINNNSVHTTIQEIMDILSMGELSQAIRINIVADLLDIALADGKIHETEIKWIKCISDQWDIPINL